MSLKPTAEDQNISSNPAVDSAVVLPQAVRDELSLVWGDPASGVRFSMQQHNDQGRGRDIVVIDEKIYTRLQPRGWFEGPVETAVYELWLDDAARCVADLVRFAAPSLELAVEQDPGGGIDDAASLRFTLSRAEVPDPNRGLSTLHQTWRSGITFEEISGQVVIDATTGVWLSGEIDVRYALVGADRRHLRGMIEISANVEILRPEAAAVETPSDVAPLPHRVRLVAQQERLLHGLAAP